MRRFVKPTRLIRRIDSISSQQVLEGAGQNLASFFLTVLNAGHDEHEGMQHKDHNEKHRALCVHSFVLFVSLLFEITAA
jgi:hypothetical protein